jgi:hypothetical protein
MKHDAICGWAPLPAHHVLKPSIHGDSDDAASGFGKVFVLSQPLGMFSACDHNRLLLILSLGSESEDRLCGGQES